MLKAVILNDTRGDNHFGCFRVMRVIEEKLAEKGITVRATSLVRNDWEKDRNFLAAMAQSDIIVINGEGTLHHGAKAGERLLKIVDHPARGTKPVVLINTLYQENPATWGRYLDQMALIATRDSWSAEVVREQIGRQVTFVPDLSLAEGMVAEHSGKREILTIGDSVSKEISRELLAIAATYPEARLLPITTTIKASKPHFPQPLKAMREAYIRLHAANFAKRHGNVLFNKTEADFIYDLKRSYLHVTGRFHSICFCLFTQTPFLALDSNSWKIEALLNDLDLGKNRLITLTDLHERLADPDSKTYSDTERRKIEDGLAQCKLKADKVFDEIRSIAERARI
ncbi:polysaccharide pyruvyl transferase family protein [Rhizobium wenxiniae]|uniref:polysaccharide pyruvyl transferase family protein n=1 Tax=Rhizobium wenxiniae TaxID=1737357 RepID=UPI003C18576A